MWFNWNCHTPDYTWYQVDGWWLQEDIAITDVQAGGRTLSSDEDDHLLYMDVEEDLQITVNVWGASASNMHCVNLIVRNHDNRSQTYKLTDYEVIENEDENLIVRFNVAKYKGSTLDIEEFNLYELSDDDRAGWRYTDQQGEHYIFSNFFLDQRDDNFNNRFNIYDFGEVDPQIHKYSVPKYLIQGLNLGTYGPFIDNAILNQQPELQSLRFTDDHNSKKLIYTPFYTSQYINHLNYALQNKLEIQADSRLERRENQWIITNARQSENDDWSDQVIDYDAQSSVIILGTRSNNVDTYSPLFDIQFKESIHGNWLYVDEDYAGNLQLKNSTYGITFAWDWQGLIVNTNQAIINWSHNTSQGQMFQTYCLNGMQHKQDFITNIFCDYTTPGYTGYKDWHMAEAVDVIRTDYQPDQRGLTWWFNTLHHFQLHVHLTDWYSLDNVTPIKMNALLNMEIYAGDKYHGLCIVAPQQPGWLVDNYVMKYSIPVFSPDLNVVQYNYNENRIPPFSNVITSKYKTLQPRQSGDIFAFGLVQNYPNATCAWATGTITDNPGEQDFNGHVGYLEESNNSNTFKNNSYYLFIFNKNDLID